MTRNRRHIRIPLQRLPHCLSRNTTHKPRHLPISQYPPPRNPPDHLINPFLENRHANLQLPSTHPTITTTNPNIPHQSHKHPLPQKPPQTTHFDSSCPRVVCPGCPHWYLPSHPFCPPRTTTASPTYLTKKAVASVGKPPLDNTIFPAQPLRTHLHRPSVSPLPDNAIF